MVWTASDVAAQGLGTSLGSSGTFTGSSGLGSSGLSSGGFTGTSGGFTGSSGGMTGGFSGGGFTGSTAFRGGTTSGFGGATGGTTTYGSTSFEGKYYANPLAIGAPTTSSTGSQYLRAFPTQLPTFGQPLYGSANLTTTPRTTTNPYQTNTNTYGTAVTIQSSPYGGANTAGIRRAPQYIAVPVFDQEPRPTASAMQGNLQAVIDRSTRLPSRAGITVSVQGDTVVLRGQVRDDRERRLAESVVRLSHGVHQVRNELVPLAKGTGRP
jgi:hypothetical protein